MQVDVKNYLWSLPYSTAFSFMLLATSFLLKYCTVWLNTLVVCLLWGFFQLNFNLNAVLSTLDLPIRFIPFTWPIVCSWVKRDQLDATCFIISLFNAQHVSDVNTSILRSLRLMYWELFHGLYCSGSMCVGVTLWFGCGGVVSVCRLRH